MFQAFKVPIGWGELFKRTGSEAIDDNVTGLAAELAYYFFLALFPALLFLVALASFFPLQNLMDEVVKALSRFAPGDVVTIMTEQMKKISESRDTGLLTLGFLGTLWSTSSAMTGIVSTLNRAYEITEGRPWWKVRLIAIGLTIAVALFILVSFALVLVGPSLAQPVAEALGLGSAFATTWGVVQWPLVFVLVATAIAIIYRYAPDAEQEWQWITPGSLLATVLWIGASLAFRFYVTNFGSYTETYGAIGGVIITLLWMYLTGLAILIGAEMNAEIEHASPYGKSVGEKRPGERKKLGAAARRAYEEALAREEARARGPERRPLPAAVPVVTFSSAEASGTPTTPPARPTQPMGSRQQRRRASDRTRLSDWILGGAAVAAQAVIAVRAGIRQLRKYGMRPPA